MKGVLPGYMKPLMLVNGDPLIRHADDHAHRFWGVDQTIVVAAPENAALLTQVVYPDDWVLQPRPNGVIDAIRRALPLVTCDWTVILCADNTFGGRELGADIRHRMAKDEGINVVISVRHLDHGGERFTCISGSEPNVVMIPRTTARTRGRFWIGPLAIRTTELHQALATLCHADEEVIEIVVNRISGRFIINLECNDVGTPDAAVEATR